MYLPLDFPYCTAFSSKCRYCGILEAAKSKEGLVVASVGLYCEIAETRTNTRKMSYANEAAKASTNCLFLTFEVARISDDCGVFFELFKCGGHIFAAARCKWKIECRVTRLSRSAGVLMGYDNDFDLRFSSKGKETRWRTEGF